MYTAKFIQGIVMSVPDGLRHAIVFDLFALTSCRYSTMSGDMMLSPAPLNTAVVRWR